jgi:CubicO group peptidase (beta-lactamase class C family)
MVVARAIELTSAVIADSSAADPPEENNLHMSEIQGDHRFSALRDLFQENLDAGEDLGASLAVVRNGVFLVDLWGGWVDIEHGTPWVKDTITATWSVTKTMTALAALVLVDRGELDVYAPVARYWPEFAANGKAGIEVRHLLSHTSGVSGWARPFNYDEVYDWDRSTSLLAAQAPWWEPGSASGYHATSFGHLVGEVVRRITGTSIGRFFADEIAGPLGADFHIGLPERDFPRVSNVVFPGYPFPEDPLAEPLAPDSVPAKTAGPPFDKVAEAATDAWRRAEIPADNGHGNARSVARIQSIVSNAGEVDGVRLLSPRTIELIFDQQSDGVDLAVGLPARFGIGYGLPHPDLVPYIPDGRCCFWFGWGGAIVINDLDRQMTFAYVMNKMALSSPGGLGTERTKAYTRTAFSCADA